MNNINETEREEDEIYAIAWKSFFFPYATFVGAKPDPWAKTGRILLALGRTEEEAIMLSRNKVHGGGTWRIEQWIKNEENV